jgi:hypothetical protein
MRSELEGKKVALILSGANITRDQLTASLARAS